MQDIPSQWFTPGDPDGTTWIADPDTATELIASLGDLEAEAKRYVESAGQQVEDLLGYPLMRRHATWEFRNPGGYRQFIIRPGLIDVSSLRLKSIDEDNVETNITGFTTVREGRNVRVPSGTLLTLNSDVPDNLLRVQGILGWENGLQPTSIRDAVIYIAQTRRGKQSPAHVRDTLREFLRGVDILGRL